MNHSGRKARQVKKHLSFSCVTALTATAFALSVPSGETAHAQISAAAFEAPAVFQAAGPNIASIQGIIDQYRLAIGGINNASNPGPLPTGRREINWDGGGSTATSPGPTPFLVFLNSRGAFIETPGSGFVQAPLDGLVTTFSNPSYATIFQPFSPVRLFSPVGSRVTDVTFFVPGGTGIEATTRGFGAVFSDVDQPNGDAPGQGRVDSKGSTFIQYFGVDNTLLYGAFVPASPGDASLSFLGVLFSDARVARVRIRTGNAVPGKNDTANKDIVMMDDFIYAEPQAK
jgi:hypothetical protein